MTQTDLEHAVKVSETWYEATAARQAPRAPLKSRVAADVCVIGGGLAGLTLTRELQRRGRSVVLLEARRIAWGASGRNGGSVSSGFSEGIEAIASRHGLSVARELFRLSALGTDYIGREIAAHDPSIKMGEGSIVARRVPDRDGTLRHAEAMARDYGRNLDFLGREELRLPFAE